VFCKAVEISPALFGTSEPVYVRLLLKLASSLLFLKKLHGVAGMPIESARRSVPQVAPGAAGTRAQLRHPNIPRTNDPATYTTREHSRSENGSATGHVAA